jgi:RimJ/RimL family protein N-acetyltransferase
VPAAVRIVPIAEGHLGGFHAALDRVARERKYISLLKAPPLGKTRKFVLENIRSGNPQFVALSRGRVVGWCDVVRNPRDASRHCGVLGVALVPEFRGKGIGERLMRTTIDAAWAAGLTRIELMVLEGNRHAIALYARLGFEREGVRRKAHLIDGKYSNLVAMALLRQEPRNRAGRRKLT